MALTSDEQKRLDASLAKIRERARAAREGFRTEATALTIERTPKSPPSSQPNSIDLQNAELKEWSERYFKSIGEYPEPELTLLEIQNRIATPEAIDDEKARLREKNRETDQELGEKAHWLR